jgi:hypothetical protein
MLHVGKVSVGMEVTSPSFSTSRLHFEVPGPWMWKRREKPALLVIELVSSGPVASPFTDTANTVSTVQLRRY